MTLEEEKVLLDEIRTNPGAFGTIFDEYYKGIFGYVFRRTADYDLALDISSETFLKAFLGMARYQSRGISISFWLYRIATNELNAHFRRVPFLPSRLNSLSEQDLGKVAKTEAFEEREALERELALHEEFLAVLRELRTMPLRYQEVVSLRYFEKKTIREIGVILGKSEGTVKSLLFRGVEKLRLKLTTHSARVPSPHIEA